MAKARDINIPIAVLRERLSYDPGTGVLAWIGGKRAGKAAGSARPGGYHALEILFEGKRQCVLTHRAAFALFHGRWPTAEVDHINGKPR